MTDQDVVDLAEDINHTVVDAESKMVHKAICNRFYKLPFEHI